MREFMSITKALNDQNRIRVLMALESGELCACQIIELLGLAPSTVSKHMAILRQARLVDGQKNGRWIYYHLANGDAPSEVREAIEWVFSHLSNKPKVRSDADRVMKLKDGELMPEGT